MIYSIRKIMLALLMIAINLSACSAVRCDNANPGSGAIIYNDTHPNRCVSLNPSVEDSSRYELTIKDSLNPGFMKINIPDTDSISVNDSSACLHDKTGKHNIYMKTSEMLEWEIALESKPQSCSLIYAIDTENLIFYYQHPDTFEAYRDDWHFAEDVPGSYAVYHAGIHCIHSKAFQLYRPMAWDSDDDTTWCEIEIDTISNLLTLILPDRFIEQAIYPVVIDPTFGYTDRGAVGVHMETVNFSHRVNYDDPYGVTGELISAHICGYRTTQSAACTASVIVYSYDSTLAGCDRIATSDKIAITKFGTGPDDGEWFSGAISGTLSGDDDYIVSWQGREDCNYCLRICADYTGQWGFEQRYNYSDWGTNQNLSGYSSNGYCYSVYVEYQDSSGQEESYIRSRKIRRGY